MKYDVAVIGGGPAGLSAALYAARAGRSTVVLEGAACGGQMLLAHEVENYPGFTKIGGMELADAMTAQAVSLGVSVSYRAVSSVQVYENCFILRAGNEEIRAGAVIAASGARRRKLGVPGEEEFTGRGVSYCAVCDGRFFRGKDAVVVGGGNTALGDALYLAKICRSVTVIHRRDSFRADHILVERIRQEANVRLLMHACVESIRGTTKVEEIAWRAAADHESAEVNTIFADCVFIAVGSEPNIGYLQDMSALTYDAGGYIQTDERCRTGIPGLFAAGDVRAKSLRQIATAVSDGAIAGVEASEYLDGVAEED